MSQQDEIAQLRALIAELTHRVYTLERIVAERRGIETPQERVERPSPAELLEVVAPPRSAEQPTQPVLPRRPVAVPPPTFAQDIGQTRPRKPDTDLESRIGSQWLNRIGIVATLFGVSYFLKYAFDNNWIGPAGRVAIGLVSGIAIVLWSERFRSKGYLVFSWSLKAVGIGAMYLSLWASFQLYHLLPVGAVFGAMIVVTGFTAALSLLQDAEILAALAVAGGFITPVLLSTGQNHEVFLFSYVALLDIATVVLLAFRPWRRLLAGTYIGTQIMFWGWYLTFYKAEYLEITAAFATVFFLAFLIAPLITPITEGATLISRTLVLIPLVNAAVFFLTLYALLEDKHHELLAWLAVALAAIYLVMARQLERRGIQDKDGSRLLDFIYIALAVGFLTTAIPLKLSAQWITFGWLVESAVLLYAAYKINSGFLKGLALVSLVLGLIRLVGWDSDQVSTLLLNTRFALYVVAIAAVAWAVYLSREEKGENVLTARAIGAVAVNVLALLALSLEIHDYFQQQIDALYRTTAHVTTYQYNRQYYEQFSHFNKLRGFTYSAVWMAYGAILMWLGFVKRTAFLRWQALVLLAVTIVKVFIYDTSQLETPYRVLSFIALGIILLGVSFAYQKDWLKLNVRHQPGSEQA